MKCRAKKIEHFFGWFIPLLFCSYATVGCWVIYLGVSPASGVWLALIILSALAATLITRA